MMGADEVLKEILKMQRDQKRAKKAEAAPDWESLGERLGSSFMDKEEEAPEGEKQGEMLGSFIRGLMNTGMGMNEAIYLVMTMVKAFGDD